MDILLLPFDGSQNNSIPETESELETASAQEIKKKALPIIEQLAIINGRTSLYWTARAVAQSKRAGRILVACNPNDRESLRPQLPDDARFEFQDFEGDDPFQHNENRPIAKSARDIQASASRIIRRPTVIVACGRPLLHGKTIDALIERAQSENLDSAAVIIDDATARAAWGDEVPAPHRLLNEPLHYLPLGVIGPQLLAGALRQSERFGPDLDRIENGGDNFKNLAPLIWKMLRTVGIGLPWKFMRRKATAQDVENVMAKVFDTRFAFVPCDDANLVLAIGEAKHRAHIEKLLH